MARKATAALVPRVASARVVNGRIVTRAKFPEGTKLIVQVEAPETIELAVEDEAAIERALASVRAGKGISLDKFRAIIQRL